jgi:flagellar basal body-associated protein FliL
MMNAELTLITILQIIAAALATTGILALMYWLIENPVLADDEMRSVLEQYRSMCEDAHQRSRQLAQKESEKLYR